MKKQWIILLGFVAGVLVSVLVPLLVLATGAINFGADAAPGLIERTLAPWAVDRSVKMRALKDKNSFAGDPAAIATGLEHYRENCLVCHGAPGVEAAELSKGLNPPAPILGKKGDDTSDGELFWIVKHGIRMTPMPAFGPTHTDDEIWKIAAFIRHLPDLTAQERDALRPAAGADDHHHAGKTPERAAQPVQPAQHNP